MFEIVADTVVGNHRYVKVAPAAPETLAADLAPRITQEYVDPVQALARLREAASDLVYFDNHAFEVTEEDLAEAVAEEIDAVLPASWREDRPQQLDTQRSEFGEILGAEILSSIFDARIPASRIKHKEIPDQATRGADVVGLEGGADQTLFLVLGEVKGSEAAASPPSVVAGMVTKLTTLATNRRALLQELIWLRDHAVDEHAKECAMACFTFTMKKQHFEILLAPILVRTQKTDQETDPGVFKSSPSDLGARVRWTTVILDVESLFDLAKEVYEIARGKVA